MTFEQLHYFTESYRQKSLGKAAANLYVSRQSLSTSIRKIEQEFRRHAFCPLRQRYLPHPGRP